MSLKWVFFDVGETLVDETRAWGEWADWLGVPRLTLFAALGSVIERGEHHRLAFEAVRPGIDLERESRAREAAGKPYRFDMDSLYPDALPALVELRGAGLKLGITGNHNSHDMLARLSLPVDVIASSAMWGVEKPSPGFFARLCEAAGAPAHEIMYVGDRLDNDVLPARAAGMVAVFLRRGPWGLVHARRPDAALAHARIDSLRELLPLLAGMR